MLEIRVLIKFDISKTLIASYCWRKKKKKKIFPRLARWEISR